MDEWIAVTRCCSVCILIWVCILYWCLIIPAGRGSNERNFAIRDLMVLGVCYVNRLQILVGAKGNFLGLTINPLFPPDVSVPVSHISTFHRWTIPLNDDVIHTIFDRWTRRHSRQHRHLTNPLGYLSNVQTTRDIQDSEYSGCPRGSTKFLCLHLN